MGSRIIAFALTFILLFSSVSVMSVASADNTVDYGDIEISFNTDNEDCGEDNIKDTFSYSSTVGDVSRADYFYRDSYFISPANLYNSHLATLSLAVAMTAISDTDRFYDNEYRHTEAIFADMGFDTIKSNIDTDLATTSDTMGVIMAKKPLLDGAEPHTLVVIGFRSGGYGSEWANNFVVGSADECPQGHLGFHKARDRALEFILSYLDNNVEGNAKIWISGFSRGGAVSGLTGAWFNDNTELLSEYGISLEKNDVFTYTFEAPASIDSELNKQKNYDNIFNIIDLNDMIPMLPFEGWGLSRPGITHSLTVFTDKNVDVINKVLSDLNTGVEYISHKFEPYFGNVGATQAEFLNRLCDILSSRVDRGTYADKLEDTMSHIFDQIINSSNSKMAFMIDTFAENILGDLGLDSDGDIGSDIFSLINELSSGDAGAFNRVSEAVVKNLEKSEFVEACDRETIGAINLLLSVILDRGDGNNLLYYLMTLVNNPHITDAHSQELIFASLVYEDSYYSNSDSVLWSSGYMSDDRIATVTVNDGKKVYTVDYKKGTSLTLSANATGCIEFSGWYVDGEFATDNKVITFVADKNISVRAAGKVVHRELGEWTVENAAILFSPGSMSRECAACGAGHTADLPAPLAFDNPLTYVVISGAVVGIVALITAICVILRKRKRSVGVPNTDNSAESEEE